MVTLAPFVLVWSRSAYDVVRSPELVLAGAVGFVDCCSVGDVACCCVG